MAKHYHIELDTLDLAQLLDGLAARVQSWERTADYLRTERMPDHEVFLIEECGKAEEADNIAKHYRDILHKIEGQIEVQR